MRFKIVPIFAIVFLLVTKVQAAQFFNDRISVQGFLKQAGAPLNDLTGYPMTFVINKNGTAVWCQIPASPVVVADGIFSELLSGVANCQSLANTLSDTTFSSTANTDVFTIDVIVDVSKRFELSRFVCKNLIDS